MVLIGAMITPLPRDSIVTSGKLYRPKFVSVPVLLMEMVQQKTAADR